MINELIKYPVVGFTVYKSNQHVINEIARKLKTKDKSIKIIFGGPQVSSEYFKNKVGFEKQFQDICDLCVVGEGERPILSFLQGDTKKLAVYEECVSEALAIPDYSDFDLSEYPKKGAVSVTCSRGCIKQCTFCAEKLLYKKFRTQSTQKIIEQIAKHKNKGVKQFIFHDSLINGDLNALENLCDEIVDKFGNISWEAQIAIRNDMPEELFKKIKKSGCYHLFVGLESGCDKTLKNMNKGFTSSDAVSFFKKLKKHELSFGVSIITGFPQERQEDFQESLDFIISNKEIIPKIEQINPFVYYAGIDLPKEADYKNRQESIKRAHIFIEKISDAGFKHTKAFMMNLVEPEWK